MTPSPEPYMTRGTRYAVVFLFVLTLAIGSANLLFTSALVHRGDAAKASITQLCQAANAGRARQVILWTHLIAISRPPPHETPAAKTRRVVTVRVFLAYVHHVFAPQNCSKE